MHGNESGAVTTINFPHERIFSVAADQLHLADYLFGAGDWRVRVHLIWRGKPIWISESRLRPLRFASLRPQTGSAGCSHSHQRGLHGQQDVIRRVIDETDRSGYTGCTNLKGASWNDCMGEASWGSIAGWGAPIDTTIVAGEVGMPHIASHPHRRGNITLFLDTGIWHRLGVVRWRGPLYSPHPQQKYPPPRAPWHGYFGQGTCQ